MRVSYTCSECDAPVTALADESTRELVCPNCQRTMDVPAGAIQGEQVRHCVACPSEELYVRKDFPQRLGIAIVVLSEILSTITWYYRYIYLTYGIFFTFAALDFALYFAVGNLLQCYRCQAQYRGMAGLEQHSGFDLETHEKHRQQLIRLDEAERSLRSPSA